LDAGIQLLIICLPAKIMMVSYKKCETALKMHYRNVGPKRRKTTKNTETKHFREKSMKIQKPDAGI